MNCDIIGKTVTVIVDRKMGSRHPKYTDMIYPINYGYVPGVFAEDGEEQDAYILGVDFAVDEFCGVVIAVIHRIDDNEDKWVVAEKAGVYTAEEILQSVHFQEQYFTVEIVM